jgi:lysozyme
MKTLLLLLLTASLSALDLTAMLKVEEGFSATVYKCSEGFDTIGYGHRCEANHPAVTVAEAEKILADDIKIALSKVEALVGKDAPQEVKEIVTAMVFQIGFDGVKKFKGMLRAIHAKDYKTASKEMLDSKWAKQTPARAKRMSELMNKI